MVKIGGRVIAFKTITEEGGGRGDPGARYPHPAYVHAVAGELGVVVHVDGEDAITVTFDRTRTTCTCYLSEGELWPSERTAIN